MVDTIFADVAQPDQARIVAINAHNFLKNGGHFVISIKVRNSEQVWEKSEWYNGIQFALLKFYSYVTTTIVLQEHSFAPVMFT